MSEFPAWADLPATAQDIILLVLYLLPALIAGTVILRGYRPFALAGAMLWRFRWTNLLFIVLIAVSVGIGVGLLSQERALRQGTARAADKFDLVIAAPGSEVSVLMAAVYLQPADIPLLSGAAYDRIAGHEWVDIAAPIAFGDSYRGAPVVGSIASFVIHLAGTLQEGRMFAAHNEAVAGASAPVSIGERFAPNHGIGEAVEGHHAGFEFQVVGRMPQTGSPWDRAIIIPVESVWTVHGLANGHAPERGSQLGPPFDPDFFPGTPAILVRAEQLWANYALRSEFSTAETMAIFPGGVLTELHGLLGDVRAAMSVLASVTQILVAAGVLTGLLILMRLFARQIALLRALGSPRRFVFAVAWSYAACLVIAGSLAGIAVGAGATAAISRIVTARTDILVGAAIGWPELHLVAVFASVTVLMALLPSAAILRRPVVADLRA